MLFEWFSCKYGYFYRWQRFVAWYTLWVLTICIWDWYQRVSSPIVNCCFCLFLSKIRWIFQLIEFLPNGKLSITSIELRWIFGKFDFVLLNCLEYGWRVFNNWTDNGKPINETLVIFHEYAITYLKITHTNNWQCLIRQRV